jgi:hypothetical protein
MNQNRIKNRRWTFCLLLTLVLFLGLVQWSFLPLLLDSGMPASSAAMTMAAGHSSKFAAPFKLWFGESISPISHCVLQSADCVPSFTASLFQRVEQPVSTRDDRFFSHRQLRAPPSL